MKRLVGRRLFPVAVFFILSVLVFPSLPGAQQADDVSGLVNQYIRLYKQGRYREAIPVAEKVLAIQEKTLGADHPNTALALNNLAAL